MSKRKAGSAFEIVSLGRSSYASKSAIQKLLAHIDANGLPATDDTSAQWRARKEITRAPGPYGQLCIEHQVPLAAGGFQAMSFQNPFAFLHHNCKHSPHYARVVQEALQRSPCTAANPWRIIFYQDGVDPSDGLSKNHSRKSCVFYWAFAELGMSALAHEEVWGTVCICRHSEHSKLAGQVSALFAAVLSQFFGEPHDFRLSGCSVTFPNGESATIIAEASVLLADLPALSECISCKGHSGTLCCPCCANAVQQNSASEKPLHALTNAAVSIANTSMSAFTAHTDESIRQVVRRVNFLHDELLASRLSQDEYNLRCQVLGWNWTPANLILNDRFRVNVASMVMYDWAHVYVHGGVADVELGQCIKVFYSSRSVTSFAELGEYASTFTYPKTAPNPAHLFTASANSNNSKKGTFSCTGSEFLTLVPVLHRYFTRVVAARNQHMPNVKSMIAVLTVVMMLMSVRSGTIQPDDLFRAITEH